MTIQNWKEFNLFSKTPLKGRVEREKHLQQICREYEDSIQNLPITSRQLCVPEFQGALNQYQRRCENNDPTLRKEHKKSISSYQKTKKCIKDRIDTFRHTVSNRAEGLFHDIKALRTALNQPHLIGIQLQIEEDEFKQFQEIVSLFQKDKSIVDTVQYLSNSQTGNDTIGESSGNITTPDNSQI